MLARDLHYLMAWTEKTGFTTACSRRRSFISYEVLRWQGVPLVIVKNFDRRIVYKIACFLTGLSSEEPCLIDGFLPGKDCVKRPGAVFWETISPSRDLWHGSVFRFPDVFLALVGRFIILEGFLACCECSLAISKQRKNDVLLVWGLRGARRNLFTRSSWVFPKASR